MAEECDATYARVLAGDLTAWRARSVARQTLPLSVAATAYVDAHVAPFAHKLRPSEVDRLVAAAVARFMPEDAEAQALRGRAHLALKQYGPAVDALKLASEKLPDRPDVFYTLALALDASAKADDARKAADRAVTLAPGWAEARELSQKLRR